MRMTVAHISVEAWEWCRLYFSSLDFYPIRLTPKIPLEAALEKWRWYRTFEEKSIYWSFVKGNMRFLSISYSQSTEQICWHPSSVSRAVSVLPLFRAVMKIEEMQVESFEGGACSIAETFSLPCGDTRS